MSDSDQQKVDEAVRLLVSLQKDSVAGPSRSRADEPSGRNGKFN